MYYLIEKIKINEEFEDLDEEMIIYMVTKGNGIAKSDVEDIILNIGSTILLPVNTNIKILGNLEILRIKAK